MSEPSSDPTLALAISTATVLVLGLLSGTIKNRAAISEPAIALLVGVLLGPRVGGLLDLHALTGRPLLLLHEAARVTLSLSVMGAALRLPQGYVRERLGELARVLGLGMLSMWLVSSLLLSWLLGLPPLLALLAGAVLTPTDPVLSDAIVTGHLARRHVPARMRHILTAESAANDGLGLLLVMLPVLLLTQDSYRGGMADWLGGVLLWEVLGGLLLGLAIGSLAAAALRWARRRTDAEESSLLTTGLALALTVLGVSRSLGIDGIFAVFVAGLAFNAGLPQAIDAGQERIEEAVGRFFDLPVFIVFGSMLPWTAWGDLGGALVAAGLAVLLLRRIPAWLLLHGRFASLPGPREALFNGWFGPIGIAALFYATLPESPGLRGEMWTLGSFMVFVSVLVHGITATPLTVRFGRR